jgi:hypothetical protein
MRPDDEMQKPPGQVNAGRKVVRRPFLVCASLFLVFLISPVLPTPGEYSHLPSQWVPPVTQAAVVLGAMIYTVVLHLRDQRPGLAPTVQILFFLAVILYGVSQNLAECWVHAFGPL